MRTRSTLIAGIAAMVISSGAQAYPSESIVRDPVTGNYTITYLGDPNSDTLSQTVFVPATKIEPTVRSSFRMGAQGFIIYRYTVSNGATAKQALDGFLVDEIANPIQGEPQDPTMLPNFTRADLNAYTAAIKVAAVAPVGWDGDITRDDRLNRISWRTSINNTAGLPAGHTLSGFGFSSKDLPSVGPSKMDGRIADNEIFGFPDDGPSQDSAVFDELNRLRDDDYVTLPAAVPMIAVPAPFDAAVLLERIQAQMHTWIDKQLLDATLSSQLDRSFQSAISAYRLNQPKVGKQQIEAMRALIRKEQPETGRDEEHESGNGGEKHDNGKAALIDRLAARVLDFDLDYVLKRMEKGDPDHDSMREGDSARKDR